MFSLLSSSDASDRAIDSPEKSNEGVGDVFSTSITPTSAGKSISWNQAHDFYCRTHGTLKASIQQVLRETCEENQEIPWKLPRRNDINIMLEADEVAGFLKTKRGNSNAFPTTPRKSSPSSWLMSPFKMASAVASIIRYPDDDVDEWIQDGDDAFLDDEDNQNSEQSSSDFLPLNTPIVNLYMTESSVRCLENKIGLLPPDAPLVLGLSEWRAWARSAISVYNTNNSLCFSEGDDSFLLQVLVGLNKAIIIRRENPKSSDLVVLSSSNNLISGNNDGIPDSLRVPVSLWDIQKAEEMIEKKLQEWSEQAQIATKNALEYKKRNQLKLAKIQLTKRRFIQNRIDSDSRLQIQLLHTKNAIESAQSNRSMIDLMADSAQLLRQLREETPITEIDETMTELQSEIDDIQSINDALSSLDDNATNTVTEEELLKELQLLSIGDTIPDAPVADTTSAVLQIPLEKPKSEKIAVPEKTGTDYSIIEKRKLELA